MSNSKHRAKVSSIAALTKKLRAALEMSEDNVFNKIKSVALDDLSRRLEALQALIGDEELKIAFIGPVGVGKTAIICDLLGLRRRISTKNGIEYKNVLTTSAGRTTACEIEINISDRLSLEVIPMSQEDQEQVIHDYCLNVWKQAGGEIIGEYDSLASELQRLIGNIIGVNSETAIQMCKSYILHESEGFDEFYGEIFDRFNAIEISKTSAHFDGKDDEELDWIAKNFGDINLGKAAGFPIPSKLILNLPKKITQIPDNLNVKTILDTKGLDSASIPREDIDYIIDSGDYICLFVDRFGDAPNSSSSILSRHITTESKDIEYRCAILVNTRSEEVDSTMNDDGEYVSDEEAYSIKSRQIMGNLYGAGVQRFIPQNVIFFDPYKNFFMRRENLTPKAAGAEEATSQNTSKLWSSIVDIFSNLLSHYDSEADESKKRYDAIALSKAIDLTDINLIKSASDNISKVLNEDVSTSKYFTFYSMIGSLHVSTFRAVNNRYGDYNGNSVYHMFSSSSRESFRILSQNHKDSIAKELIELRANCKSEELKICLEQYLDKLDADFEKACEVASLVGRDYIDSEIHPTRTSFPSEMEEFWSRVISRWGKGPGYRDDVIANYRGRLEGFNQFSVEKFNEIWHEGIANPYATLLLP